MYKQGFSLLKMFEVITWIGLFSLIPFTALGYFAEGSIPGQPLYPLKRGIENVVLAVDSLNANAKAFYQVALVNKRLQEVEKLLASSQTVSELNIDDVSTTLAAAQAAIGSISDSIEKKQVEDQLVQSITTYKEHLQELKTLVENSPTVSTPQVNQTNQPGQSHLNITSPTNIQMQVPVNSTNNNLQNGSKPTQNPTPTQVQAQTQNAQQTPVGTTPTPSSQDTTALTPDQKQQIIANIDQITQTLDQTVQNITGETPSPMPSPLPTFIPTPTDVHHRDSKDAKHSEDHSSDNR